MSEAELLRPIRKRGPEDGASGPLKGEGGRPLIELDTRTAERLASIQCTDKEIAHCLGVSEDTMQRRKQDDPEFAEGLERARSTGKMSLRRVQWQAAQAGNATMMIWLGKNHLGQRDHHEVTGEGGAPLTIVLRHLVDDDTLTIEHEAAE